PAGRAGRCRPDRRSHSGRDSTVKKWLVLVCMLASAAEGGGAPLKLSFHDALARAIEVNNSLERSRAEVGAADQNRKQLLSSILPQVNLTGSSIRNSKQVAFGSGADQRIILPSTDWNYRVVLSQPVYAGLREKRA